MKTEKYRIDNCGCDDETVGIFELTQEEFQVLNRVFEELNKNSRYKCMPRIFIERMEVED